ncbi:MAG: redoxin domain-containing protein [Arcobacter sp.]|nr:redoxin domain-containing protein [Arcobacter sp.]
MKYRESPSLEIQEWINTNEDITLEKLKGKIVIIYAFQMLCPGCLPHSIPQSKRLYEKFKNEDVVILGLHTVFEHKEAMNPNSLKIFMNEYKVLFPVGIDLPLVNDLSTPYHTQKNKSLSSLFFS